MLEEVDGTLEPVVLRGRLLAEDLAFLWRVRAWLRLGLPVRVLAGSILALLVAAMGLALHYGQRSPDAGGLVPLMGMLIVLVDLLGLRFLRYRLEAALAERKTQEHVARFDDRGFTLVPAAEQAAFRSFGWPLLELLSTPRGLIVALRNSAVLLAFIPRRDLSSADRGRIETIARLHGSRVLDGPRGREIAAPSDAARA